jgi:hypothetical protein
MIIDLTALRGTKLSQEQTRSYEGKDLPGVEQIYVGPFTGSLRLGIGSSQSITFAGTLIAKVVLHAPSPTVVLKVPSPVPSYEGVHQIEISLHFEGGDWKIEIPGKKGWFKEDNPLIGKRGQWLQQSKSANIELKLKGNGKGFPLEQLGITEPMHWSNTGWDHFMHIGMTDDISISHDSFLLVVPTGVLESPVGAAPGVAAEGLKLLTLKNSILSAALPWTVCPVFLGRRLSEGQQFWRIIVQWNPLNHKDLTPKRLDAWPLRDLLLCRPLVRAALAGWHSQRSAQPLMPLPLVYFDDDANEDEEKELLGEIQPILVFDLPNPATTKDNAKARLRHIHLNYRDEKGAVLDIPVRAQFPWQVRGNALQPPIPSADILIFYGSIRKKHSIFWPTVPNNNDLSDWANRFKEACKPLDEHPDWLSEWNATGRVEHTGGHDRWQVWGSLEFNFDGANTAGRAELQWILRGEWTEDKCDIYPESVLTVDNCRVRVSPAADAAGRDLDAASGTLNEDEDSLQRDSEPLRFPKDTVGQKSGRPCQVRITHRAMPGRNAITKVEVHSTDQTPLGDESVVMQMRPFFVGVVQPADIDPESGTLIATWASNDPEGQQWRVPDTTASVTFPPQAVGEAMERGVRFWQSEKDIPEPWLDPKKPLPYRFAPPTQIVVRPSVRERRYNKSPGNLGAVLSNARVHAFTTEMVYPVEARFQASDEGLPDIRITETASMLGRPAQNLEPLPDQVDPQQVDLQEKKADRPFERWLRGAFSSEAGAYAGEVQSDSMLRSLAMLRVAQAAAKASFAARLAQFHVYDPWSPQGGLGLMEGVKFTIRGTKSGAPPLANPLVQWITADPPNPKHVGTDLTPQQKKDISAFLNATENWGKMLGDDGSIPAGVVHTIEFASELVAVLRTPTATRGRIESLAFSALGASGQMSASFDEGRTTFIAESSFGQLSRLIKVRIGRVGVLWNKAKHVIVYERSTVYSKQFKDEQTFGPAADDQKKSTLGWPVLRKTEEYVEPIEIIRRFGNEEQKDDNRAAFLVASEFVTPRVYVNGAWGRDLGHGYEIPLWNANDHTGSYPKPGLALQARASGSDISRCWLDEPDQLFFYTNTEAGTGDDPDKWKAQAGVDCPDVLARLPQSGVNDDPSKVLKSRRMPSPRLGATRRPRFDLAIRSDGKVDLQHERGKTQMLTALDVVSLARTAATTADTTALAKALNPEESNNPQDPFKQLKQVTQAASRLDAARSLQAQADALLTRAAEQLLRAGEDCEKIKGQLQSEIKEVFDEARNELVKGLDDLKLPNALGGIGPFTAEVDGMRQQLHNYERSLRAPFDRVLADLEQLRLEAARAGADDNKLKGIKAAAQIQIKSARELIAALLKMQKEQLKGFCDPIVRPHDGEALTSILEKLSAATKKLVEAVEPKEPKWDVAQTACKDALSALQKVRSHAVVGPPVRQLECAVRLISNLLDDGNTAFKAARSKLKDKIHTLSKKVQEIVEGVEKDSMEGVKKASVKLEECLQTLQIQMEELVRNILRNLDAASKKIDDEAAQIVQALRDAIDVIKRIHDAARHAAGQEVDDLASKWRTEVDKNIGNVKSLGDIKNPKLYSLAVIADGGLQAMAAGAIDLGKDVVSLLKEKEGATTDWLANRRGETLEAIGGIKCSEIEKGISGAREQLRLAEDEIRAWLTDQVNEILDGQTRQQLAELEKTVREKAPQFAGQASEAIKLMKALGELPSLPTLTFNADRAEYLFDDFRNQIETSPFAAKLGEIDSGLKGIGITVPCRELLDQLVPRFDNLDFDQVFRNFAGIDFSGLLKGFRLPQMESEQVKITHGVDEAARSAWVTTKVNAFFPEERPLFEFAGLSVTFAQMKLLADSEVRVDLDGNRKATTDARLTADWGLQFGGAGLAKFREVTVRFDGSSFRFDIEPSKVELHPALKFIDEFVKRFTPKLPPAVEIEKDSRGIPVGARASMVTDVVLGPLGAVEIGPMKITSGLSMRMAESGQFGLTATVSVGSRTAPVWVQIGYLGGGMWLEARAAYQGQGQDTDTIPVRYSASVGLALGCIRAINISGVAQGSFALLLFAYAEISESGGSLRVGFSITGSARILGMCNASVLLLLEAEHKNGEMEGRGTLDVKVEICWCYTLHVRREVNHKIEG